ncbi:MULTISPECIES: MinD/ParA family protein [Gammaproteobacteria]|jgi:flagellar biosynthesis protein FlhG|uniref:P-loop NTPase n=1 Tax=Vreelandella halophila TaxID=86177 RepID=A0A9X5B610_9GAMM|nr:MULTISPECIES: MinD/ParA family protein [Gammaproteobacteria]KAA8984248.1 MinD/ParA family protein [Halospina sp. K52047b]MYL27029.1 P-loop NTPase [Halomonas utahensis]MYL75831.1 P-loop NTPase [Halomonas sp. 22501_18_FS]
MSKPVQVIAVTGGKGGVGKSNVSVNLGIALSEMGQRVVVLDADLGLANIDVLLGISATYNISDVLAGECSLTDILVDGPGGIRIVPASSGTQRMTNLSHMEHAGLISAFSELGDDIDVLIVDTAAGISESVVSFLRASQELMLVVNDEPTSITDTYALIKLMNRDYGTHRFRVLANMVRTEQDGKALYDKLYRVTERFLDVALQYVGSIPLDEQVKKAVRRQKTVMELYPNAKASQAFRDLAKKVDQWPLPSSPRGHLEFFVERLVQD